MKAIFKGENGSLGFAQQQEYNLLIKAQKGAIYIWTLDKDGNVDDYRDTKTCNYGSFAAFQANWEVKCESIYEEIALERLRQDSKFGIRDQHPSTWLTILQEEVGEVAKEICDNDFAWFPGDAYRKELIEVAAVAEAAIENYDRKNQLPTKRQVDMLEFAEWCGHNYIKLEAVWCHKFADQRNHDNYLTTQQLLDIYIANFK